MRMTLERLALIEACIARYDHVMSQPVCGKPAPHDMTCTKEVGHGGECRGGAGRQGAHADLVALHSEEPPMREWRDFVRELLDEVSEAHAEAKHLHLCLDLLANPGIVGPPSIDSNDEDSENDGIRLRAGYMRVALWTFAQMAAQHPAPNYLAILYDMPDKVPEDMDVMMDLKGYSLEIAAVKPGGVGPSKRAELLKADVERLTAEVARYQSDLLEAETEKKDLRNDRDHWRSVSLENAVAAGKLGGEALVMKQELTRQLAVANMERAAAAVMIQRFARRLALAGGVPLDLPNEVAGNADNARMFLTAFGLSASGEKKEDPS